MGLGPPLSSHSIQQIITERDLPRRLNEHPEDMVRAVYRYGAPVGSLIEKAAQADRLMPLARRRIAEFEASGRSLPSGTVLIADSLSGSRGRFDRIWHAPPGGLWLNLILANTLLPENAQLCPLAVGAACCETIRSYGIEAKLKWVNDVLVGGRKISGVLTESFQSLEFAEDYLLIGIGVNVNNRDFPQELKGTAIAMAELLSQEIDLADFAARLLASLSWYIGLLYYDEERGLYYADGSDQCLHHSLLLDAWRRLSDSLGRRVWFGFDVQREPQYQADVLGLAPDGGIRLRQVEGGLEVVEHSGELLYLDETQVRP